MLGGQGERHPHPESAQRARIHPAVRGPDRDHLGGLRDDVASVADEDRVLIDEVQGEAVGFWRQLAPLERADGSTYEIAGTGGSWFRYAGDYKWSWQRDFFDHANAGVIFGELMQNGQLTEAMQERMKKGSKMPGWVKRGGFDWYDSLD